MSDLDHDAGGTGISPPRRLTRGSFVKAVGSGLAGGMLLAVDGGVAAAHTAEGPRRLRSLDHAAFAAATGDTFLIQHGLATISARLLTAGERSLQTFAVRKNGPEGRHESFTLVFEAPRRQPLSQGTYTFRHRKLGTFSLFIVPGIVTGGMQHYDALFNRLASHT